MWSQGLLLDPEWYKPNHVNKWDDVKHSRSHLIIGHCEKPLTSMKEITNDDNDSQGTLVHSNECEWVSWSQTLMEYFNQRPVR